MLDLNLPPDMEDSETFTDQTLEDEPLVGQTFSTFEEAYVFYENYAKKNGFIARKDRSIKRNGKTVRRDFYCHRSRKKPLKPILNVYQRNRGSIKCECKAHVRVTLKKSFDIFPEEWHVTKFVKDHNHELLSREEMRFLPVNRIITPEDEKQILLYKDAGLTVRQIIRVMELQKQVKHGYLSFLEKDVRNLFTRLRRMLGDSDAMNLLDYMKFSKESNINFQYVYTIDEERRLENLFWCHPQSFEWYEKFGDVVVFDTTYKVNTYDMPCGLFVGINNHGKTVLFGAALLRNETTKTFRWLMKTFVTIMNKPPKTIITDQDPWMSEAIALEMPSTKHSFCIWHITSKFSCWFTSLLRTEYQNWCGDFYTLYRMTSIEEFEKTWPLIVSKYNLHNNNHVQGLYGIRKSWAPAYLRNYFFGGMTSTSRSESVNAYIKKFVYSRTNLRDFVKQIDIAVEEMSNRQSHNKMLTTLRQTSLKTKSPLEKQAFEVLTPFAFKKFQGEFESASQYLVIHAKGDEFIIRYYEEGNHKYHKVFWDGYMAWCSCKNFEFWGILCRHIIRALIHNDCFKIPPSYFPLRWCFDSLQTCSVTQDVLIRESSSLVHAPETENDIFSPPKSTTKGRPRNKRIKSGKEKASKTRNKCSNCNEIGHTKPTCKNKEKVVVDTSQKRKKEDLGLNPVFTLKQ